MLEKTFTELLSDFESGALIRNNGDILSLKYETLADIGTLPACTKIVSQYLPLKMGEAVILNDPYSGGTILSTLTIITPVIEGEMFYSVRIGFRPSLKLSEKIDDEGLRIPPTPLVQNFQINQALLAAMCSHPMAPENIGPRLEEALKIIFKNIQWFNGQLQYHKWTGTHFDQYIKETRSRMLKILQELPFGESKAERKLESGEILKAKITLNPQGILIDFAGTTPSKRICLTDSATLGACIGAFLASNNRPLPLNSGLFSLIHVSAPLGSFLNAKFPSPTFLGMTEGASLVASTVLTALSTLSSQYEHSEASFCPLMISLDFGDKRFFDSLPGGSGATAAVDGVDGISFWVRNKLQPSVEEIERRFPVRILQWGLREGSGGKGRHRGGNGITKEYEILKDALLTWACEQKTVAPKGSKGAQAGDAAEMFVVKSNGEKKEIKEFMGSMQLSAGDKLMAYSAGGGGFGKS